MLRQTVWLLTQLWLINLLPSLITRRLKSGYPPHPVSDGLRRKINVCGRAHRYLLCVCVCACVCVCSGFISPLGTLLCFVKVFRFISVSVCVCVFVFLLLFFFFCFFFFCFFFFFFFFCSFVVFFSFTEQVDDPFADRIYICNLKLV